MVPSLLTREIGENAQFLCRSYGNRTWAFNNGMVHSNVVSRKNNSVLIILNVQFHNAGFYRCITHDQINNEYTAESVLKVTGGECFHKSII